MTSDGAWALLIGAGLLENFWASALKHTAGMTQLWPSVLAVAAATLSFVLLAVALRQIPMGVGYAAWVGIGAAGTALAGVALFNETMSLGKAASLGLIVLGVAGVKLFGDA